MKHIRLLTLLAVVAMLMTSCQQFEEGNLLVKSRARFAAYTEEASRTTMGDNYSVVWSERDTIVMFGVTDTELYDLGTYTLVEGAGTTNGVFEGELNREYANYYAFYPVSMFKTAYLSGKFKIKLPYDGIFTERNFVDGANPMIACGDKDSGLQFRNICGILELKIKGDGTISGIVISDSSSVRAVAGEFDVDAVTAEIVSCTNGSTSLSAELATPIELSNTEARSIYVILPPGEYKSLRITTFDNAGNSTVRTATNPVTITRSKITPVTEFEHKVTEGPCVSVAYASDESNFYTSTVKCQMNSATKKVKMIILTEDEYKAQVESGLTDAQIAQQSNLSFDTPSPTTLTYPFDTYTMMGQTIHVLAVPCDAQGNYGEVTKMSFVSKVVPIDNNYSVEVSGEPAITANSININFATTPVETVFRAYFMTSAGFNANPSWVPDIKTATEGAWTTLYSNNGTINLIRDDLAPETEYKLIYRVMSGVSDGIYTDTYTAYSEYKVYTFTTPAYTKSTATVNLSMGEVKEWKATVYLSSWDASEYSLYLSTAPLDSDSEYIIQAYGTRISADMKSYTYSGLTENTKYYLHAIAYDADGVYGAQNVIEFTTLEIVAEPNVEYSKFLGNYTFYSQNGMYDNESRTVTITQAIEGKVFHVKGLLHPMAMSQYGVTDDTLEAKFYDNMIHVGGTPILGSNSWGTAYVYATAVNALEGRFYYNSAISSAYNDGVLTFDSLSYPGYNGLLFYPTNSGSFDYGYIDLYSNLVLIKQASEDGQLENPGSNPEIDW